MKPASLARLLSFLLLPGVITTSAPAQATTPVPVYSWTTLAGRASIGNEDGPVAVARFNNPHGLALDLAGNLYVADTGNHTIRKISPAGIVTTFAGLTEEAGTANGVGSSARFNRPQGVAVDLNGNVYVADTGNHTIRKITPAGNVTTLAGQAGIQGTGDGASAAALFDSPDRITVDTKGNVYLANNGVRKISNGQVQTLPIPAQAMDPDGNSVTIYSDRCPAVDAAGLLYFPTSIPGEIARINGAGVATIFRNSLYGVYNSGSYYALRYTSDTIFNGVSGNLFINILLTSGYNPRENKGIPMLPDGTLDLTLAQNFTTSLDRPTTPLGLVVDPTGKWYYTRDDEYDYRDRSDNTIMSQGATFAGTTGPASGLDGTGATARLVGANYLTIDPSGTIWFSESVRRYISRIPSDGETSGTGLRRMSPNGTVATVIQPQFVIPFSSSAWTYPTGLTFDGIGNYYLARETWNAGNFDHDIARIASDGTSSSFDQISHDAYYRKELATDISGKLYQVFDAIQYQWILQPEVTVKQRQTDGTWVTIAGGGSREILDGTGATARFSNPTSLTTDRAGTIFLLDYLYSTTDPTISSAYIRKISQTGVVTTVSKKLTSRPTSLAVDSKGTFFLAHSDSSIITQIDANGDEVTIGGFAGKEGSKDGTGDQARFAFPGRITIDAQDNLYLTDGQGTTIRKGQLAGAPVITTQPSNQTAPVGTTVQFSVSAGGSPAPTYQWFFNGNAFSGATTNTLSFANARSTDAGDYTVVVTNSLGSVTSNKATLTVSSASAPTPAPSPSGGTTGGGGSIEAWFALALLALVAARVRRKYYRMG